MPLRKELLEAMEAARVRAERDAERDRRRDVVRTILECLAWCALGLLCIGWGFHTTDALLGKGLFYLGVGAGNAGIIFALLGWYRRAEQRGDF